MLTIPCYGSSRSAAGGGRVPAEARLALTGSEQASHLPRLSPPAMWSRIRSRVLGAEHVLVQRLAGTVFLIRVVSALLAFGSQVLFARWMGSFQFGIYVYVWTWVMLIGQAIDLGLGTCGAALHPTIPRARPARAAARFPVRQ